VRNLFLALVLANLAFAAYHGWFAGAPAADRGGAAAAPGLVLASEVDVAVTSPAVAGGREPAPQGDADAALVAAHSAGVDTALRESAVDANDDFGGDNEVTVDTDAGTVPARDSGGASASAVGTDASASDQLAAATKETRCISVGPFRELSQAATAAANLRASGLDPSQRAGEGEIWVGYWVYIEQIPSVAAAEEILGVLRENGITDSYVIPRSGSGTLVSLGVFTEINRARNRREAVSALGYEATISDRTRRATVYWIEVNLADGEPLDFEQLQPPGRIVRLEQRVCEDAPR